jgi:hypothetical protein
MNSATFLRASEPQFHRTPRDGIRLDVERSLDEESLEAAWVEGQRLATATAVGPATS